jgi:4-amino-4-deoxychorismate lyase
MAEPASVDFELFTTLRYDPALILADWNQGSPLFLMKYHARRLQKAAEAFHWEKAQEIANASDFEVKFKALCKRAVQGYKGEEQALKVCESFLSVPPNQRC